MAQNKTFEDVDVNLLHVEPQDLSTLNLGAEEDNNLYRHDGSSSITTESGSTSKAGFYAWNNEQGQFANVGGLDETVAAEWQAEHTFQAGLLVEDDIRSTALGGNAIWDESAGYIRQAVLENDSVSVTAGSGLSGGGSISLGGSTSLSLTNDSVTINAGAGLTGGGSVALGNSTTVDVAEPINARQANVPLSAISDTDDAVGLRKRIPSGKTLKVFEVGVINENGNAPSGLTVEVYDVSNATLVESQSATHAEGSPLASKSGAFTAEFRISNDTGSLQNASAYVLYSME